MVSSLATGPSEYGTEADIQLCTFLMENMALSISYWGNYHENKPKLVWKSENRIQSNHVLYFHYDNWIKSGGIVHSHDYVDHQLI